ncbi:MAG: arginine deiminase family protein [Candidatus Aenigmatarchaeota archaeon]
MTEFCVSETIKPTAILVHEPGEEVRLAVENPEDWGTDPLLRGRKFDEWIEKGKEEHRKFVDVLKREGVSVKYLKDLLSEKPDECAEYLYRELERVAPKVRKLDSDWQTSRKVLESTLSRIEVKNYDDAVSVIINGLEHFEEFRRLPYQTRLHIYRSFKTLMPQTSLFFIQDPVQTSPKGFLKSKMAMWIRAQEPDITQIALGEEKYIYKFKNPAEGGDMTMWDGNILFGVGAVAGTKCVTELQRQEFLEKTGARKIILFYEPDLFDPSKKYVNGNLMHLDTIMTPVGDGYVLGNSTMLKETVVQRPPQRKLSNAYDFIKRRAELVEVPDEEQSGAYGWGANVIPLGDKKVLTSPHTPITNNNMRKAGFNVIETPSETLVTDYGHWHCMSTYLSGLHAIAKALY